MTFRKLWRSMEPEEKDQMAKIMDVTKPYLSAIANDRSPNTSTTMKMAIAYYFESSVPVLFGAE